MWELRSHIRITVNGPAALQLKWSRVLRTLVEITSNGLRPSASAASLKAAGKP